MYRLTVAIFLRLCVALPLNQRILDALADFNFKMIIDLGGCGFGQVPGFNGDDLLHNVFHPPI